MYRTINIQELKKEMVNRKTIIVGLFVTFAILVISAYAGYLTQAPESSDSNIKSLPEISSEVPSIISLEAPSTQSGADIQTPELSESGDDVVCDQPPKDNKYGGISGSENKPPKGTTITEPKTGSRTTATGICGTYQYIAGWWFTASEIAKLPYDTIMYGTSPYTTSGGPGGNVQSSTTTPGGDNSGDDNSGDDNTGDDRPDEVNPRPGSDDNGDGNGDDDPVVPIPEVATFVLVVLGVFVFVAWRKTRK